MAKFKVGNRVIYAISDCEGDRENNPLWNGKYGRIVGTITCIENINPSNHPIHVRWDNGTNNKYKPGSLKHYKGATMKEKAKEIANNVHNAIRPYEKYIGLVALALVIDHFFLGNKFTDRFKALAEALVSKITASMDKVIHKLTASLDDDVKIEQPGAPAETITKEAE